MRFIKYLVVGCALGILAVAVIAATTVDTIFHEPFSNGNNHTITGGYSCSYVPFGTIGNKALYCEQTISNPGTLWVDGLVTYNHSYNTTEYDALNITLVAAGAYSCTGCSFGIFSSTIITEVYNESASAWDQVGSIAFQANRPATTSRNYNVTAYKGDNTQVRIRMTYGIFGGYSTFTGKVWLDDLKLLGTIFDDPCDYDDNGGLFDCSDHCEYTVQEGDNIQFTGNGTFNFTRSPQINMSIKSMTKAHDSCLVRPLA